MEERADYKKSWLVGKGLTFLNNFYNQATTKLAFHSNETSKDKLSII